MENKMVETQNQKSAIMTTDQGMLTGVFHDRESLENAYKTLQGKGCTKDEINIVMSEETRKKYFSSNIQHTEFGTYTVNNVEEDPDNDSTFSEITEVITAKGTSVVVRGLVIVMVGPISAGLEGAGASGIPGGIIGALVGAGFSKPSAYLYEERIKKGDIVIGVQLHNEKDANYLESNLHPKEVTEIHI